MHFFSDACLTVSSFSEMSIDDQLNYFNTLCGNVLDIVALFKTKKPKLRSRPWLNKDTCASRQEWRKA